MKLQSHLQVDLISILDINEVDQKFVVQFNLHMSWYDYRLKFYNMKTNINMNTLTSDEKQGIWVPVIVFSNTKEKDTTLNDDKSYVVAERMAELEYSDETMMDNIFVFQGPDNPLVMSRVYFVNWICNYKIAWYPFDTQTCNMILSPDGNSGEFIHLIKDGLEYLGPMDLATYYIKSMSMIKVDESIDIQLVLGRRLLGVIFSIYIPTMLLVSISYLTNFFKPSDFDANVAVNLTCMLVRIA